MELPQVANRLRLVILLPGAHPSGAHRPALIRQRPTQVLEHPLVEHRQVETRLPLPVFRQAVVQR